jgi:hypothetical protein
MKLNREQLEELRDHTMRALERVDEVTMLFEKWEKEHLEDPAYRYEDSIINGSESMSNLIGILHNRIAYAKKRGE